MDNFWNRWLELAALAVALIGIALALLAGTQILGPMEEILREPIYGSESPTEHAREFNEFVFGVLGGVMLGWGIFTWFIVRYAYRKGEPWAWWCLNLGLVAWFLLDSFISGRTGVWVNVGCNTVFMAVFLVPLSASAPRFLGKRKG